jgi:hypothetical protein
MHHRSKGKRSWIEAYTGTDYAIWKTIIRAEVRGRTKREENCWENREIA